MFNHELYQAQSASAPLTNGVSQYGFNYPNYNGLQPYPQQGTAYQQSSNLLANENLVLRERLDSIQAQLIQLTELVRRSADFSYGRLQNTMIANPYFSQQSTAYSSPSHEMNRTGILRENDTHIFWEICLPNLSLKDVDLEISGNRVICRTKVPVAQPNHLHSGASAREFEMFMLPDGRVEFNWIVPVKFDAKEVEATWREGFISICVAKQAVAERQSIKITKDSVSSKKSAA